MKRIAYGIHGYGRGHATRSKAIMEYLKDFDIRVYAGGQARPIFPDAIEIPCFTYGESLLDGIGKSSKIARDIHKRKGSYTKVREDIEAFRPDLIITDSESYTAHAGKELGVPVLLLDHFSAILKPGAHFDPKDRMALWAQRKIYDKMIPSPDGRLSFNFYNISGQGSAILPNPLRERVLQTTPTDGEHVLCYFSDKTKYHAENALVHLRTFKIPTKVYGSDFMKSSCRGSVEYCSPGEHFVDDLASCKAVIGTSGNQLIGEAAFYQKPFLALPEQTAEQRANAYAVQTLGLGRYRKLSNVTFGTIALFLERAQSGGFSKGYQLREWLANQDSIRPIVRNAVAKLLR